MHTHLLMFLVIVEVKIKVIILIFPSSVSICRIFSVVRVFLRLVISRSPQKPSSLDSV